MFLERDLVVGGAMPISEEASLLEADEPFAISDADKE